MILTPLQKLPSNVGDLGKIIVANSFEWLPKVKKSPNLATLLPTNVAPQNLLKLLKIGNFLIEDGFGRNCA